MSILGDIFPAEGNNGAGNEQAAICESNEMADLSSSYSVAAGTGEGTSSQAKKRSRPPRTCNICGLQVTGQRSSLIYHANSKYAVFRKTVALWLSKRCQIAFAQHLRQIYLS